MGNDYFTPGWTDYKKRVYYQTYDVTELVRSGGANVIGGVLAGGWYYGAPNWLHYGDRPRLWAQLEIELADGTVQTVVSDGSWRTAFGPYIESGILAGETYDATKEISGWASPGAVEGDWRPVAVAEAIPAKLEASPDAAVQETGELKPVRLTEPKPGVTVFDLGQNFAGFARLKVRGPRAPGSSSASPRCSIPTARSTRPISAPPGPPTSTSSRAKARRSGSRSSPTTASVTWR